MRFRLVVAALVNSVFLNVQGNMAAGARQINMGIFLPITSNPELTLNQYLKVGQKPVHSATPKKGVLNISILHHYYKFRNKFLQLTLNSLDSASWELHQYLRRMCGPMKIPKLTPAPRIRTRDLTVARPTLYPTTPDTTQKEFQVDIFYSLEVIA